MGDGCVEVDTTLLVFMTWHIVALTMLSILLAFKLHRAHQSKRERRV